MSYRDTVVRLNDYRKQIAGLRSEIRALQATIEPETVPDYVFRDTAGAFPLSTLFGDKPDLFVIHNIGKSCPHCTIWADGFNGVLPHLEKRAAFAVSTPDDPQMQAEFAQSRGWKFRIVSHAGTSFAADMGYQREGRWWPGVSVFRKEGEKILRVSDTGFGPDDDFCVVWNFMSLLPDGEEGWRARLKI